MNIAESLTSTYTLILLVVMMVSLVVISVYYGLFYLRVGRTKKGTRQVRPTINSSNLPSVSVVILAHNEAAYLKESLPFLLEQDYPDYEVIVVDYLSTDDTPFVLKVCSESYSNIRHITFSQDVNMFQGKKYPLSIGIQSAKKDVILLTDPDCAPTGFSWIKEMMSSYQSGTQIVLGTSPLKANKDSNALLYALQVYENLNFTASSIGMTMLGHPYTGTGRNLSYRRAFFLDRGGFQKHYREADGADDLFVNFNADASNTSFCLEEEGRTYLDFPTTFGAWKLQRHAHWRTKRYYDFGTKLMLSIKPLCVALFYASWLILLLAQHFAWQILLGVMVLKLAWEMVSYAMLTKRFSAKKNFLLAPLFELYFLIANTILYFSTLLRKKQVWR